MNRIELHRGPWAAARTARLNAAAPVRTSPTAAALGLQGLEPDALAFPAESGDSVAINRWASRVVRTVQAVVGMAISHRVVLVVCSESSRASAVLDAREAASGDPVAVATYDELREAAQRTPTAAADLILRRVIHATGRTRTENMSAAGEAFERLHGVGTGTDETSALVAYLFSTVAASVARDATVRAWGGWRGLWPREADAAARTALVDAANDSQCSPLGRGVAAVAALVTVTDSIGIDDDVVRDAVRSVIGTEGRRRKTPADLFRWSREIVSALAGSLPTSAAQQAQQQQQQDGQQDGQQQDGQQQDGQQDGQQQPHGVTGTRGAVGRDPATCASHALPDAADNGDRNRSNATRTDEEIREGWTLPNVAAVTAAVEPTRLGPAADSTDEAIDGFAKRRRPLVLWHTPPPRPRPSGIVERSIAREIERIAWMVCSPLREDRGLRSGRLDASRLSRIATHANDPRCWSRRPDAGEGRTAVLLLVDCSGSMGIELMHDAQSVAVGLLRGLQRIPRCDVRVVGHNARYNVDLYDCGSDEGRIASLEAGGRNEDGIAIAAAVERFEIDAAHAADRLVLILSDGQPNGGNEYRGPGALRHVRRVLHAARNRGTQYLGVGFGDLTDSDLRVMYGPGRSVRVRRPSEAGKAIAKAVAAVIGGRA
jgi:hypothetical protein